MHKTLLASIKTKQKSELKEFFSKTTSSNLILKSTIKSKHLSMSLSIFFVTSSPLLTRQVLTYLQNAFVKAYLQSPFMHVFSEIRRFFKESSCLLQTR